MRSILRSGAPGAFLLLSASPALALAWALVASPPPAAADVLADRAADEARTTPRSDGQEDETKDTRADGRAGDRSGEDAPIEQVHRSIVVTAADPGLATEEQIAGRELGERGARDLVEALRGEPALDAVRRGPINLDPNVRGLQEGQVAALVDGTRTFSAGPGRMDSDLSHVAPGAVEGVQVVKGPYALAWGAGALSAIRVETFRPPFGEDRWGGDVGGSWGENGSVTDGAVTVYQSGERSRFVLMLGSRSGDDYRAGDGSDVPADYRSESARWRLGLRPTDRTTVEYSGGYQGQHDIDYPGRILDATYFFTSSHAVDLDWTAPDPSDGGRRGALRALHGQVYVNDKRHRMNNDEKPTARPMPGRVPPFGLDVDLPTTSDTLGGSIQAVLDGGGIRWTVGGDVYDLQQDARRTIRRRDTGALLFEDTIWPDAELIDAGVYGQGLWRRGAAEVAGTVRLDRVDASAGTPSEFFLDHTEAAPDQAETNLSAALSGRWRLTDAWVLTAGLGRAVRTATITERYSDRLPSTRFQVAAEFLGDPGLRPEASHELDLGSEIMLGGSRRTSALLSVDLFYRRIDDYITVLPDATLPRRLPLSPSLVYRYVNGDGATFLGGELALRGSRPLGGSGARLAWRAASSYVRGEDETFDEPAFGVPPLSVRIGGRWTAPRARLGRRYGPVGRRPEPHRHDAPRAADRGLHHGRPLGRVAAGPGRVAARGGREPVRRGLRQPPELARSVHRSTGARAGPASVGGVVVPVLIRAGSRLRAAPRLAEPGPLGYAAAAMLRTACSRRPPRRACLTPGKRASRQTPGQGASQ